MSSFRRLRSSMPFCRKSRLSFMTSFCFCRPMISSSMSAICASLASRFILYICSSSSLSRCASSSNSFIMSPSSFLDSAFLSSICIRLTSSSRMVLSILSCVSKTHLHVLVDEFGHALRIVVSASERGLSRTHLIYLTASDASIMLANSSGQTATRLVFLEEPGSVVEDRELPAQQPVLHLEPELLSSITSRTNR